MLKQPTRRHGRILPIVAGTLMLGLPMLAMMTPQSRAEEPDAGAPDPKPHVEATPTATPMPSGYYQLDNIEVTESDDDPDGFFKTTASNQGVSLNASEDLSAGNYGESWLDGSFSKSVSLQYDWTWVTDSGLAPAKYTLTKTTDYSGNATATPTGASTAAAGGSYFDSIGGVGGGNGSSSTTLVGEEQDGASTVSASLSMTVSGSINVLAKQGNASGKTKQSATGEIELG